MADVLRLALNRRDELEREMRRLDDFIRMAESLVRSEQTRDAPPKVDPFQARFNSGEVLPPLAGDDHGFGPGKASFV